MCSELDSRSTPDEAARGRITSAWARAVLVAGVVTGAVALTVTGLPRAETVRALVDGAAGAGPVVAVMGCAALTLAFVPRSVVAVLGGVVFGPLWGAGYVLAGAVLGATVAYLIGAALGQELLDRRMGPRWRRAQRWLLRRSFAAVIYSRLLPVVPFGLLNYAFGAAGISLRVFVPATLLGIAPSTLAYAALGRAAMTSAVALLGIAAVAILPLLVHAVRWATRPRA
jgi:uncharacterized membrane protein YdjX (TVP38/TMEM64 family)